MAPKSGTRVVPVPLLRDPWRPGLGTEPGWAVVRESDEAVLWHGRTYRGARDAQYRLSIGSQTAAGLAEEGRA